jgi:hypothetical protein
MRSIFVALSNETEDTDDEFNKWYDEVHIPDVLAIKGYLSAQRFELVPDATIIDASSVTRRYLAIYELEADDAETVQTLAKSLADGLVERQAVISETMDASSVSAMFFVPATELVSKDGAAS